MAQIADKLYFVEAGSGYMRVTVTQASIDYRGERNAVAKVAWDELVGEDSKGDVVRKHSPTRSFIAMAANDINDPQARDMLFNRFRDTIKFKLIGLEWRERR
jgi:hypothetical protein